MLWPLLITLALVKLAAASMMLWLPFRTDSAVLAVDDPPRQESADSDEDGGSRVSAEHRPSDPHPRLPHPRRPRRGPHGSLAPEAPRRVRRTAAHLRARTRQPLAESDR